LNCHVLFADEPLRFTEVAHCKIEVADDDNLSTVSDSADFVEQLVHLLPVAFFPRRGVKW